MKHELKVIIERCDTLIKEENFEELMDYYTDDAILVIKPGTIAQGKEEIKKAFIAIAAYFNNSLVASQGKMEILEAGDTALVLSQTFLEADKEDNEYSMERRATYVFKKDESGKWLCSIDNSYGASLLDTKQA
ncbi:DUF4440 domain-containing protein [Priestia megaterium]|nr:DUF4440 domain-containing protein [Priestia megaterium]